MDVYTRQADGGWRHTAHENGALTFDCGGLSLGMTVADIYEDVIGDACRVTQNADFTG